ncbi:MAG TPA: DUF5670 family protein [Gemmatimonadaceae bacterium]|nr:DUF5670 family protein [Gemmatimonadaceae bacterium]
MDIGIIAAVILLILWAVGTFALMMPGWIHILLTLGVFLLIWRIVVLGTRTRRGGQPLGASTPPEPQGTTKRRG